LPFLLSSSCLSNGGFVPDSRNARSFIINQIGGFVLQKLSAHGH